MRISFFKYAIYCYMTSFLCVLPLYAQEKTAKPPVNIPVERGANPWTHLDFADPPNQFSFAITADLTGGERPGVFDVAVAGLNLLVPEFVVTVGDLIEGYTTDKAEIHRQWDHFDQRVAKLNMPFFYLAGNHDISNPELKEVWRERRGRPYYHFVYKGVLFLMLNTEDMSRREFRQANALLKDKAALEKKFDSDKGNGTQAGVISGFISQAQVDYFKRIIHDNPEVRWTFIFMHNPMWQGAGSDALREIESFLGDRPFTAFSGHSHAYKHFGDRGKSHIRLGTTGGGWSSDKWIPDDASKFDHIVMVTMKEDGPIIANLKLEGILNERGEIPANGRLLQFQK